MDKISFILYIIGALGIGIFNSSYTCYIAFTLFFILNMYKYIHTRRRGYIFCSVLASIIIPTNYIVYIVLFLTTLYTFPVTGKIKVTIIGLLLGGYITLHTWIFLLVGKIKIVNLLFSVLYYLPLVISCFKFKDLELMEEDHEYILDFLRKSLWIQVTAIATKFIFQFQTVAQYFDFDWVTGTFGDFQGNILLFYAMFCLTIFWSEYQLRKKDLTYVILSAFIGIMTGSIALLIIYLISFCGYSLLLNDGNTKKKFYVLGISVFAIGLFILVTPEWIKNYIILLVKSPESRKQYITKLQDYYNVFKEIPAKDFIFLVVGNGLGMYCSRAALTCTGIYIPAYNRIFAVSMSEYTTSYIFPKLTYVYANLLGSMDTPYCSLMSVFSEFGMIGMTLIALYFTQFYRKAKGNGRIFIIFFVLSCFIENYLEFSRVVPLLFVATTCINTIMQTEKNEKRG